MLSQRNSRKAGVVAVGLAVVRNLDFILGDMEATGCCTHGDDLSMLSQR